MFTLIGLSVSKNQLHLAISLILSLLVVIGQYHVFQKAGAKGWYACIPFKDMKTETIIAEKEELFKWDVITFLGQQFFLAVIAYYGDNLAIMILSIIMIVILLIMYWIVQWKITSALCTKFGKSKRFAVCLYLFPYVFMMILGFDGSVYTGKKHNYSGDVL